MSSRTFNPLQMDVSRAIANALLDTGAVKVSVDPPFRWTSGLVSPVYCDLRSLSGKVEARRLIAQAFLDQFPELAEVDVIAGTATAGVPWAAWVAELLGKPMVYVRSKAKGHGTKRRIEGHLEPGSTVAVIEDLISTGGSSISSAEALREEGQAKVENVYAINSYEMKAAGENFPKAGLKLGVLTTFATILSVATERGDITSEQEAILLDFREDPPAWAGKHGYQNAY